MLLTFRFFCVLCIATIMTACAPEYMKPSGFLLNPTHDKALVRFMRPEDREVSTIWDREKAIGNTVGGSQFDYLADPGKHLFYAATPGINTAIILESKAFLEADIEAGKTYYIITRVYDNLTGVALIGVSRSSELWDKVKEYEIKLTKLQPNPELWKEFELEKNSLIQKILNRYVTDKMSYVRQKLSPEDGR